MGLDSKEHILSLSYGKDSLACLGAIEQLGWPLDRIIHSEVWATDTIQADLPPMVEFKKKADAIIKERYGITVEHSAARMQAEGGLLSYERQFYKTFQKGAHTGEIYGFPLTRGTWCNSRLKMRALSALQGSGANLIQYLGIAADEPERINRHSRSGVMLPLVEIGWDEEYCRKWCEENDLLSPIYTDSTRGGCWFCHNQGVEQLRKLRKSYPDLWELLLKWDLDSPTTFKPDGRTVHDYEKRFALEDDGLVPTDSRFRWRSLSSMPTVNPPSKV